MCVPPARRAMAAAMVLLPQAVTPMTRMAGMRCCWLFMGSLRLICLKRQDGRFLYSLTLGNLSRYGNPENGDALRWALVILGERAPLVILGESPLRHPRRTPGIHRSDIRRR